MTPDSDHLLRSYREGDEDEINRLFNLVFHEHRSLDEWSWKFKDNPFPDTDLIIVAEVDGKIVGQYAGLPCRYKYKDSVVKATFIVDNYVLPEFRGGIKGIQWKAYRQEAVTAAALGYAYGMGYPNREHYVIGKRVLKYTDFGSVGVLSKRLNWRLAVRSRFPWIPNVLVEAVRVLSAFICQQGITIKERRRQNLSAIRQVKSFDERFDTFWNRVKDRYEIVGVRDRTYLQWRYRKPGRKYEVFISEIDGEMSGYMVTTVGTEENSRIGYIVDFLVDERVESGSGLVKQALQGFLQNQVDYVRCWMMGHSPLNKTFEQYGFVKRDRDQMVNGVFEIFDSEKIDAQVIGTSHNWYATMGDSDAF